jgi:glycerophosphoryl diester phosphodiesterase
LILLDGSARPVIAHRGGLAVAPENTMVAFARAHACGAEAVECDIRLTADGHVVICHDATVDRTTDGTGAVRGMDLESLRRLNAAARWTRDDAGTTPLPLLSELLDSFPSLAVIIEMKTTDVAIPAMEVVRRAGAIDRVVFGAFEDAAVMAPRAAGMKTLASRSELLRLLPLALRGATMRDVPFDAISISPTYYRIPLPLGRMAKASGVPVHVWTVNDASAAHRYWSVGARGMVTDYRAHFSAAHRAARAVRPVRRRGVQLR